MNVFFDPTPEELAKEREEQEFFKEFFAKEMLSDKLTKPIFESKDKIKTGKDNGLKYASLLNVFYEIKEKVMLGLLGKTKKGEAKNIRSVEKYANVFMIRFYNSRPEFYSFKKITSIPSNNIETITIGLRFDLEDLFKLIEQSTLLGWDCQVIEESLNLGDDYRSSTHCRVYKDNIYPLTEYYCSRRLFTFEDEREDKDPKKEYATLTPEGKLLPDWFLHFKNGLFEKLNRKEQIVAYLNEYDAKYCKLLKKDNIIFDYIEEDSYRPSTEDIQAHKRFSNYSYPVKKKV